LGFFGRSLGNARDELLAEGVFDSIPEARVLYEPIVLPANNRCA
jgi:hypothetical protein